MLGLQAEAEAFNREHQNIQLEFESYIKDEIYRIREKWAAIDTGAAATLPNTIVEGPPSMATTSTRKRTGKRQKGNPRKGKKKQTIPDPGILGPNMTLDDGTKVCRSLLRTTNSLLTILAREDISPHPVQAVRDSSSAYLHWPTGPCM